MKCRCEQPAPIAMLTAVEAERRPGPEPIADVRLHVGQLVGARGTHRPHESGVGNDDGSTKKWDVDLEDVSVPLDPTPHRLTAKKGESNALHELG